jgi:probable HAF family extracellular repeat protein
MQGLGFLPGVISSSSVANGISADGSTIVGTSPSNTYLGQAFRWTAGGGMEGLGVLPDYSYSSGASGVSGDGTVVVGGSTNNPVDGSAERTQAFRWTLAGGIHGLGFVAGIDRSAAGAISADGSTIIGGDGNGGGSPFRWTAGAGMQGLGDVPPDFDPLNGGGFFNIVGALGVSGDGSVIVGWAGGDGGAPTEEAMVWDAAHGIRSLRLVLANDYGLNLNGWWLTEATAISADGSTIVGYGRSTTGEGAWIAVIPEPAALPVAALIAIGSALCLRRDSGSQRIR